MCPNGNADLTRSLILHAATAIISKDGLDALTAGRLIAEASISKGGLYHHFRTMADVEMEVLDLLAENLLLKLSAYPAPRDRESFLQRVEQEFFECFAANTESARALYGFMSSAAYSRQVRLKLRMVLEDVSLLRLKLLTSIMPGVSQAELNNTVQLVATMQMGLMFRSFVTEDTASLRQYWNGCRTVLESMLGLTALDTAGRTSEVMGVKPGIVTSFKQA